MQGTRLEIEKEGIWIRLEIYKTSIKYNTVINRIANPQNRDISHSDTFDLPKVHQNIQALDLNVFNHGDLARSLNTKYPAKYYVEDKLLQEGFVVFNNSIGNSIKVNFIDKALDIVGKWKVTTFRQLLNDEDLIKPADYVTAINQMKTYDLSKTAVATMLPDVGTRGYPLSLFPNNLNTIGDAWQLDEDGLRLDSVINIYQSRPVWNVKAFFDLITETYGYEPVYDASVDWEKIEETFIVKEGLAENYKEEGDSQIYGSVAGTQNTKVLSSQPSTWTVRSAVSYPVSKSLKPDDIANWVDPNVLYSAGYKSENTVFVPNFSTDALGNIIFHVEAAIPLTAKEAFSCWTNSTPGGDVVFAPVSIQNEVEITPGIIEYSVSKTELVFPPAGGDTLIGVFSTVEEVGGAIDENTITSMTIKETFLPIDAISYDEYGQYLDERLDLTYSAPDKTIGELLNGLMTKDGILMNIDEKNKKIMFFNYSRYSAQKQAGNAVNWTKYLQRYTPFTYNTDYGNSYARENVIGLNTPYSGNTYSKLLTNQGSESKLKDYVENFSKLFKDVVSVKRIPNTITPYFEYENLGLGLVERAADLETLSQQRADGSIQGNIVGLAALKNVDFTNITSGLIELYRMVDEAVKADPQFLLPIDIVREVDLTIPIYLVDLGGYYIIEEIAEYENSTTRVVVKVIKLIDAAEYSDDFSEDFNI